jgi:hypothetical protein
MNKKFVYHVGNNKKAIPLCLLLNHNQVIEYFNTTSYYETRGLNVIEVFIHFENYIALTLLRYIFYV